MRNNRHTFSHVTRTNHCDLEKTTWSTAWPKTCVMSPKKKCGYCGLFSKSTLWTIWWHQFHLTGSRSHTIIFVVHSKPPSSVFVVITVSGPFCLCVLCVCVAFIISVWTTTNPGGCSIIMFAMTDYFGEMSGMSRFPMYANLFYIILLYPCAQ